MPLKPKAKWKNPSPTSKKSGTSAICLLSRLCCPESGGDGVHRSEEFVQRLFQFVGVPTPLHVMKVDLAPQSRGRLPL